MELEVDRRNVNLENAPLVSIIIISYNNQNFLYDALTSVVNQSYPNFEIIISDDCSTDYSLKEMKNIYLQCIKDSLEKNNQKSNTEIEELTKILNPGIKKVFFNKNETNLGTVKHLKFMKKLAAGKYIMFLAADDKLHDDNVVADMISYFEKLPPEACVLSSQCGMYDYSLKKLYYFAVGENLKKIIKESTSRQLFAALTEWCLIPAAGTIYKKEAFQKYGDLDDRYHLIEDWTYFLKISRANAKIYYYDRLTYMHRDGGISHGNINAGTEAGKYYLQDSILLIENEILPYKELLNKKELRNVERRYKELKEKLFVDYILRKLPYNEKLKYVFLKTPFILKESIKKILIYFKWNAWKIISYGTFLILLGAYGAQNINGFFVQEKSYMIFFILAGLSLILGGMLGKVMWYVASFLKKTYYHLLS